MDIIAQEEQITRITISPELLQNDIEYRLPVKTFR
jgi:hypothetical protein